MKKEKQARPAIFLDRDGVLCKERGYVTTFQELEIFPYAKMCVESIHRKGFLAICITNQSAVARGMMTENVLLELNGLLQKEVGLDAVYYCPHHPQGMGKYGVACTCRKPGVGMIEQAKERFRIGMEQSYLVGDRGSDIICGQRAGLKTVLVESGYGLEDLEQSVKPDFLFQDLQEFVDFL